MNYRILLCLAFLLVGCSTSKESPTQVTVAKVLPAGWDAKAEADRVMADLIKVTTPQVKGAHDSHLAIIGNRAFVISEVGLSSMSPFPSSTSARSSCSTR
jgi:uncharacterized protein YcfL